MLQRLFGIYGMRHKKNVTKYQNLTIISSHLSLVTCVPLQFKMYISHCRYLNYDDFLQ